MYPCCGLLVGWWTLTSSPLFSDDRYSVAGYRPAAVLLHTAETDAVLIDTAGDLGVACLQLPAPAVLRQSVRSVWDLGRSSLRPQLFLISFTVLVASIGTTPFDAHVFVLLCSVNSQSLLCYKGSYQGPQAFSDVLPPYEH